MKLLERVEKKIFFRIVRSITFLIAFLALIATIAGVYASISNSIEAKPKTVKVEKEEIDTVLTGPVSTSDTVVTKTVDATAVTEVTPPKSELELLAETIAKSAMTSQDAKPTDPNYKEALGNLTAVLLQNVADYDEETKIIVLTKLNELSETFPKSKFLNSIDVYFSLFKSKHDHEQDLANQKNMASQANKMMGYSAVGAGIVIFALFVMILVLLRIEKNTRPVSTESDEYDATDKKLLIGIIGFAIVIALLIGWGINQTFGSNEDFDPVSELQSAYSSAPAAPAAVEEAPAAVAAPVDAAAPAAEEDLIEEAPAADAAAPAY